MISSFIHQLIFKAQRESADFIIQSKRAYEKRDKTKEGKKPIVIGGPYISRLAHIQSSESILRKQFHISVKKELMKPY